MERIIPTDASCHHSQRFIVDRVFLEAHEQVRRSSGGLQSLFAMLDRPLQLFSRDEDLSEASINLGLSTIQAAGCHYVFLML